MMDCAFLFADRQMEQTFKGFLGKENFHRSLGARSFTYDSFVPDRRFGDSGVYKQGHVFLRRYYSICQHAVVVLDHRWEGAPEPSIIQEKMKANLVQNGWREENVEVIVIVPELEVWLCQSSQHVVDAFHFDYTPHASLKAWLEAEEFWDPTKPKPAHPKDAFMKMQKISGIPRSGATYAKISSHISIRGCVDPAFCLLRDTLQRWFPPDGGQQ
ncbi:MAG: methylation-associated defense system protein MAD4 [Ktedonobacteraceae bacterium]